MKLNFFIVISLLALSGNYPIAFGIEGLTVEYLRQPGDEGVTVADLKPEYGWIVDEQTEFQKAYQIIVSSSRDACEKTEGNVWDSGRVLSSTSSNIEHGGNALEENAEYFWKARIWDKGNEAGPYSSIQNFRTGAPGNTISSANRWQIERIKPVRVVRTSPKSIFVDFGRAAFGTLEIDYITPAKDRLTIHLGEKAKGGSIDREPGGTIRYQKVELEVRPGQTSYKIELTPDKRNTGSRAIKLPESFDVVMPFRYVEIENIDSTLTSNNIRQKAYFYYFNDRQSEFSCSDERLENIWDMCKYSMKATSFCGLYIDGDRERIPYEADAYINQLGHYCVDNEYSIAKQTIEYFIDHPTWPTEWLLHTPMLVYQDYYYTGDTELIEAYYDKLKHKTLIALARKDGLISTHNEKAGSKGYLKKLGFASPPHRGIRDIVDWPRNERDGYNMVAVNTVVNCFFYRNMQIMAEFADLLGKIDDADYYREMAAKVKRSINTKMFDEKRGIYVDGLDTDHAALHANMMPLAFDIVPDEHIDTVVEFVKSRGMACSVYGAQYLLQGLYRAGQSQYALDLMRAAHQRSWWNMIKVGSTITLEAWDMKYKPNADWTHAWGAAPANIVARFMWGIQPSKPGFQAVRIKPQLADLKQSIITMPTIKGAIRCEFKGKNAQSGVYIIELPGNMTGEFVLPGDIAVQLNDQVMNNAADELKLMPGRNLIKFKRRLH
ncbi:alpha-glucosidase [Anaerohalosphaera lusitana]|uniref:alpha-L-rhamnosidase n=1 Tax=Anaerohalosphaera lusitana TaxID=1936003 RepID=A0A1U9NJJ2_9BACT|nr:alpha-L-rhamnosidase C-terminal domain-containing protein [Anaerohalosphaera lusitana]AQT68103.1 alpha-glucosidase [Anaerohalosphaera lusitana]